MTKEEKELSFIDISGRLHYGIIVNYKENEYDHRKWKITSLHTLSYSKSGTLIDTDYDGWISYEEHEGCGMSTGSRPFRFGEVLPYLRPMSSMTEDEFAEYEKAKDLDTLDSSETLIENMKAKHRVRISKWYHGTDWLNAHHFDYRGLIERGLAIAVTDNNNPYK